MGLLTSLLTLPISGPIKASWWLAEKLHEQAIAAMNDPAEIKRELVRLEEALEAGELTEEEFEDLELELLTRLRDVQRAGGPKG